ncbi:MAG: hypothetical protein H0U70_00350 [Tatlockia sp.]|nr:hypothetical protein [Tatlockia sp.]
MRKHEFYERIIETDTDLNQHLRYCPHLQLNYLPNSFCFEYKNKAILRETNYQFVKLLVKHNLIQVINGAFHCFAFTQQAITALINDIELSYINGYFFDDDLHDDIFTSFEVVSPFTAYNPQLKADFIELNYPEFFCLTVPLEQREANARRSCEAFLKDRSKLFCTYLFLRRCAILHRESHFKDSFHHLIVFLSTKDNMDYMKEKLRADAFIHTDDLWATGLHEWLERSQTLEALIRTAGYPENQSPFQTHIPCVFGMVNFPTTQTLSYFDFREFNWLDIQFLVRTETKHVIFPQNCNGHIGAVYQGLKYNKENKVEINAKKGGYKGAVPQTTWIDNSLPNPIFYSGFNSYVEGLFNRSYTLHDLMIGIKEFYEHYILHERTPEIRLSKPVCFSNGMKYSPQDVGFFAQQKLAEPHKMIKIWFRDVLIQSHINQLNHGERIYVTYQDECLPEFSKEPVGTRQMQTLTF